MLHPSSESAEGDWLEYGVWKRLLQSPIVVRTGKEQDNIWFQYLKLGSQWMIHADKLLNGIVGPVIVFVYLYEICPYKPIRFTARIERSVQRVSRLPEWRPCIRRAQIEALISLEKRLNDTVKIGPRDSFPLKPPVRLLSYN